MLIDFTIECSRSPESVPLPDTDDSSSDEKEDEKEDERDIDIPLHQKPEISQTHQVIVASAISPTMFYVSDTVFDHLITTDRH